MKTKQLLSLILSASILFFASCEDCTEIYKTTGMDVRLLNDSLEVNVPVDTNATVSYENLYFYIVFDWDYEHFCEPGLATETRHASSIKSLTLTCDQDYSNEYPVGSDLSSIVDISNTEMFETNYSPRMPLNEYINSNESCPPRIRLFLTVPPDSAKQLRFTIDYLEAGGQNFRFTCYPFYITP